MFLDAFDVEDMARFAAGRYWRAMSEAQQADYTGLFRRHFIAIVAKRFAGYSGETITLLGERAMEDGDVAIAAEITRRENTAIPVGLRLRAEGDTFRILDVAIEGQSMLVAKRAEFASVIGSQGIDGFLKVLNDQVGA